LSAIVNRERIGMNAVKEYRAAMKQYKKDLAHFNRHVRNDPSKGPMAKSWLMPQPPDNPVRRNPMDALDKEIQKALSD